MKEPTRVSNTSRVVGKQKGKQENTTLGGQAQEQTGVDATGTGSAVTSQRNCYDVTKQ